MLPPVDDTILKENPRFADLYKTLIIENLNPDGTTRDEADPTAGQRNAVREELKAYRLKAARLGLLRNAIETAGADLPNQALEEEAPAKPKQHSKLQQPQQHRRPNPRAQSRSQSQSHSQSTSTSTATSTATTTGARETAPTQAQPNPSTTPTTSPSLPEGLKDLLLLLPAFLNQAPSLPSSFLSLLLSEPPFSDIQTLFPSLVSLISAQLSAQAKSLARVISPSTNSSYIHRTIPQLSTSVQTVITTSSLTSRALSSARLSTLSSWRAYEEKHDALLALILSALLERKHGPAAENAELRAAQARQQAQTLALASEALLWVTRDAVYPNEARTALANYRQHLRDAGRRLEDGARVREAELVDYGVDVDAISENDNSSATTTTNDQTTGITKANFRRQQDRRASLDALGVNRHQHRRQGSRAAPPPDPNKERTMREMARVWREMEARLREIQGDLNRLR
ncbi:hypothetical protein F5Y17DRAFT_427409 [Xylariaceae sp. FL0594]|nr:hypothetical protein F5Y17DRAFT_427409 [Xylariaceae sp. FL0594]